MGDGGTATIDRGQPAGGKAAAAAPQVVVLLDCERPLAVPSRHLLGHSGRVVVGRGEKREWQRARRGALDELTLRLPDRGVSADHAHLVKVHGTWVLEDRGSKNGCLVDGQAVTRHALRDGEIIELGRTLLLFRAAVPPVPGPDDLVPSAPPGLATLVAGLATDLERVSRLAASDVPGLIRGPTGTGKEVLAAAVHALSGRKGPFLAVNCGALPQALVEAELFGHRRGAFSGATEDRPGLVRAAQGGTLFLDEVGDLPAHSQATLLRALQTGEVRPIGETQAVKVDVRVLAATHRDLDQMVAAGTFREDLYARLGGFQVALPPLAERREDLGLLVAALCGRLGASPRFTTAAGRALARHAWPHNVRELELVLRGALALAGDATIDLPHLPPVFGDGVALSGEELALRQSLESSLTEHAGNLSAVARALGKGRMQIHRWLKRYALDPRRYRR